jgi:hypothetical protein
VLLMREIYANTRQILTWIGEKEDCNEHAFEYLDRISTLLHKLEDTFEEDRVEHTYSQHMSNIMFDKSERRNHLAALSQR